MPAKEKEKSTKTHMNEHLYCNSILFFMNYGTCMPNKEKEKSTKTHMNEHVYCNSILLFMTYSNSMPTKENEKFIKLTWMKLCTVTVYC